jgi:hypothetical protein
MSFTSTFAAMSLLRYGALTVLEARFEQRNDFDVPVLP